MLRRRLRHTRAIGLARRVRSLGSGDVAFEGVALRDLLEGDVVAGLGADVESRQARKRESSASLLPATLRAMA